VVEADAATLQQLAESGGALVAFYAPWCGHCRTMVPEMKRAATMLKSSGVRVAALNTDNEPGLAQRLGIRGFPTVRWVSAGGRSTDYQGQRKALDLVSFAQQQHTLSMLKSKMGEAVQGVKSLGKLAMSKVLGRQQQPVQQAAAPAAAA